MNERTTPRRKTLLTLLVVATATAGLVFGAPPAQAEIPGVTPVVACPSESYPVLEFMIVTDERTTVPAGGSYDISDPSGVQVAGDLLPEILPSTAFVHTSISGADIDRVEGGTYTVRIDIDGDGTVSEDVSIIDCVPDGPGASPPVRDLSAACPSASVPSANFPDVDPDSVHGTAIDCGDWYGIAEGYADGRFGPGDDVTRGQLATFVGRVLEAAGLARPADAPDAFIDDTRTAHEDYINWLAQLGILQGFPGSQFRPGDDVTRGQLATYLASAYQAITGAALSPGDVTFPDDAGTHQDNIRRIAAAGFAAGFPDGEFKANLSTRRDQMASFLMREVDLLVEEGRISLPS